MPLYALSDVLSVAYQLLRRPVPDAVKNADDYMPDATKDPELQDTEPLTRALARDGWNVELQAAAPKFDDSKIRGVHTAIDQGLFRIKFTYDPLCNTPWIVWFFIYSHVDPAKRKCECVYEVSFLDVRNNGHEPLGRAPITDAENLCVHLHTLLHALPDAFARLTVGLA